MTIRHFRAGTDDARWVIPELVDADMYRMEQLAEAVRGVPGPVLDCGAHIGVFSVLLASRGATQTIHAFEPEPNNYGLLVQNAQPYPNILPVPVAVGPRAEQRKLYRGEDTGRWSLLPTRFQDGLLVRVIDLYRLMSDLEQVALLKLDLEGYEAEILNHMPTAILSKVNILIVEEHHLPIDHARIEQAGFSCWFQPLGHPRHRVYRSRRESPVPERSPQTDSLSRSLLPHRRDAAQVTICRLDPPGELNPTTCLEWAPQAVLRRIPPSARRILDVAVDGKESVLADCSRLLADHSHPLSDVPEWIHSSIEERFFGSDAPERTFPPGSFDCIVCGWLDRLAEPELWIRQARSWLTAEGCLLICVPTTRNHHRIASLIAGRWSDDPQGDPRHPPLRWFTRREIEKLFYRLHLSVRDIVALGTDDLARWHRQGCSAQVRIGSLVIDNLSRTAAEEFHTSQYLIDVVPEAVPAWSQTSVVLVTHNQIRYTRECLESLRIRTDEPYELIVIDNGSTDGTVEYLRNLTGIKLISNPDNRGFPAAVNQGIQVSSGKQVLLLNNDCVVTTGWLRRLLAALDSDPRIGLAGPCSNCVSGDQQIPVRYDEDLVGLDGFAWEWGKLHAGSIQDTDRLVGFCLLIRREVIDAVGPFDERFGIGCFEDDDYCLRAMRAGFRSVIVREAFVHHYGSRTFLGSGMDLAQIMAYNRELYRAKWTTEISQRSAPAAKLGTSTPLQSGFSLRETARGGLLLVRDRISLSLCMIVRDNARTIGPCLESIKPWVDEMVVVDTGSKDDTPQITERLGARVFSFPWCDSFSAARNESLRHARGRWLFWMDSDDTIDAANGARLRELAAKESDPNVLGYVMQVHCPGAGEDGGTDLTVVDHVKLIRNRPDLRFEGRIHEQILPAIRRAGGDTAWTDLFVVHSGYDHSPEGQRRKVERDLRLLHLELQEQPDHPFTLFNFGMTYADQGDYRKAIEFLNQSIAHAGEGESHLRKAYALLVYSLAQARDRAAAWETCAKGLHSFPGT